MTNLYHCILVNKSGYQEENLYREGDSEEDVKKILELFCYAKGDWIIELDDENDALYY